ncbi:hypothetical protein INP81_07480 [Comamonas thiooxydans]|uniref:hypothetical protein n=1 Tax=Comamonas thiooxydans TaxID=363952 RepID=UPI0018A37F7D|nr:hypothetical protein [Comamonas thiooxydans]QOQ83706.1 hypothetical protein INP81_07480 [Comamonas thiooxydans]
MTWYRDGSINLTAGSNVVTGIGTSWINLVLAGEGLDAPDGRVYEIAEVINNSQLVLTSNYLGATTAEAAYQIIPNASMTKVLTRRVSDLLSRYETELPQALAGKVDVVQGKGLSSNDFTDAERVKLAGADNRANHTGAQPLSSISDAGTAAARNVQTSQRDADRNHVMTPGAFGWGISPGTQDGEVGTVLDASTVDDMGQWVSGAQRYAGTGPGQYGHVLRMGGGKNGTNGGWFADLAVTTNGGIAVRTNTNSGTWSPWVNVMDRSAQSGVQPLSSISGLEAASSDQVLHAIAMSKTFASVPTENQGPMIVVTQPHLRFMVWDGTKYVRAPWHMPGVLFFSHAPAANVTHGIQVRADVTYNKVDHPDLAEILGVAGSTFILPEGRARVLRAADNGRGIDSALVNGYLQEDAIRDITGFFNASSYAGNANGAFLKAGSGGATSDGGTSATTNLDFNFNFSASRVVPTAAENRVKSLAATLYITR